MESIESLFVALFINSDGLFHYSLGIASGTINNGKSAGSQIQIVSHPLAIPEQAHVRVGDGYARMPQHIPYQSYRDVFMQAHRSAGMSPIMDCQTSCPFLPKALTGCFKAVSGSLAAKSVPKGI